MSKSLVEIILRTVKQGASEKEIKKDLKAIGETIKGVQVAVLAGAAAVAAATTKYVDYAMAVKQFQKSTGATAEEASKMIQVADDLGVSSETLERAMTAMARQGIALTYDELVKLSGEFTAIEDPAARGKLALEKFGKAGMDMLLVMDAGPDKLKAMGDSAKNILSQEDVDKADEMRLTFDELQDTFTELVFTLVKEFLPAIKAIVGAVTNVVESIVNMFKSEEQLKKEIQATTKEILIQSGTLEEYSAGIKSVYKDVYKLAEMNGILGLAGMAAVEKIERLSGANNQLEFATRKAAIALGEQKEKLIEAAQADDLLVESFTKAPAAIEPMIEPLARSGLTAELVKDSFGELTDEMLFQQATAGLSPQAFLDVARAMGKVDEATYMQLKAAQDLNAQYLAGQVTIAEFTNRLSDMDRWLRTIPKEIQTTVAVAVKNVTTGNVGQLPGNPTGGQSYQYGGSYAEGGEFWVERPTMIVVGERGRERVTVTPEGKGGGSVVIEQVVIQDEMTLARFEGMLKRVLKGVAR